MRSDINIHQADSHEIPVLIQLLQNRAHQLIQAGKNMWAVDQLSEAHLNETYHHPAYFIGYLNNQPFGGFILVESDAVYWPDAQDPAFYFHKFFIDPAFSGKGLARQIIQWVKAYGATHHKKFIRIDFEESRPYLNDLYLGEGFSKTGTLHHDGRKMTLAQYPLGESGE